MIERLDLATAVTIAAGHTLLVCHASYEPRAKSIADINFGGVELRSCLVLGTRESLDSIPDYKNCADYLLSHFERASPERTHLVSRSRNDRIGWIDEVHKRVSSGELSLLRNAIVDITAFPRDRLWAVLNYLIQCSRIQCLHLTYSQPALNGYSTQKKEGWLSRGVRTVTDIPGFNGRQHTSKGDLLVVVVGREHDRTRLTIHNLEPDKVILVGQTNQDPEGLLSLERIKAEVHADVEIWNCSVERLEIDSTRDVIRAIVMSYGDKFNISVASFGSKLQCIGAMIACQENSTIRGIYAEPQTYNIEAYSEGVGSMWKVDLSSILIRA